MIRDYKSYRILEREIDNKDKKKLTGLGIEIEEENKSCNDEDNSTTYGEGQQDTSFIDYMKEQHLRKNRGLKKWGIYFMVILLFLMLLPFISIVLIGISTIIGFIIVGILLCVGVGIYILGGTCFMATQLSFSMVMLGLAVAIAFLSLGSIIIILCYLLIKWMSRILKQSKLKKAAFYKGAIQR